MPAAEVAKYDALIRKSRAAMRARIRQALLAAADAGNPVALQLLTDLYLRDGGNPSDQNTPAAPL